MIYDKCKRYPTPYLHLGENLRWFWLQKGKKIYFTFSVAFVTRLSRVFSYLFLLRLLPFIKDSPPSSTSLKFQVKEEEESTVVLTSPLSLDCESGNDYRTPNLLQRLLSLLKNVRPGSDLTRFTLPPIFNIPKSQLQCYGESVYCVNNDILTRCANGGSPLERFTSVVAWSISTFRPLMFGVAPYNPCSWRDSPCLKRQPKCITRTGFTSSACECSSCYQ
ncbi:unnamed protein product [Lactuca virosa]|uniref:Uncharacterized protein n=1 Tax=Lactuca virosa TaxID=75947 RepID=A0AAU9MIQ5_9ASTR|nr:unnamed protein product [Lactuca virosa]